MDWDDHENVSATRVFLKYLTYPEDEDTAIDLQQTMVVAMAHLDRLARPFQPKDSNVKVTNSTSISQLFSALFTSVGIVFFCRRPTRKGQR